MRLSGLGLKRCLLGRKEKAVGGQEETLGRILQASLPNFPGQPQEEGRPRAGLWHLPLFLSGVSSTAAKRRLRLTWEPL